MAGRTATTGVFLPSQLTPCANGCSGDTHIPTTATRQEPPS